MNFIVDLSRTQKNFDSYFLVVDKLTKVAQFIHIINPMIASRVADLFFKRYL